MWGGQWFGVWFGGWLGDGGIEPPVVKGSGIAIWRRRRR